MVLVVVIIMQCVRQIDCMFKNETQVKLPHEEIVGIIFSRSFVTFSPHDFVV